MRWERDIGGAVGVKMGFKTKRQGEERQRKCFPNKQRGLCLNECSLWPAVCSNYLSPAYLCFPFCLISCPCGLLPSYLLSSPLPPLISFLLEAFKMTLELLIHRCYPSANCIYDLTAARVHACLRTHKHARFKCILAHKPRQTHAHTGLQASGDKEDE